jgi:hypothetical protein
MDVLDEKELHFIVAEFGSSFIHPDVRVNVSYEPNKANFFYSFVFIAKANL